VKDPGVRIPAGEDMSYSTNRPDRLWYQPSLVFNGCRDYFLRLGRGGGNKAAGGVVYTTSVEVTK